MEARDFLFLLFALNVLILFVMCIGVIKRSLNKRLIFGIFITKLVLLTGFIVYDNFSTPMNNMLEAAILGYVLLYLIILANWYTLMPHCRLKKNINYRMELQEFCYCHKKSLIRGTIIVGKKAITAFLSLEEYEKKSLNLANFLNVRFKEVYAGEVIVTSE